MSPKNIIIGQRIDPKKAARARELRRNMTEAEKILWQRLRANRLGGLHFRRQQVILGFIVDFYCHAAGLAVEVDGPIHELHTDDDRERDQALGDAGIHVLRINNQDVLENLESTLWRIRRACDDS
jgi:very-short-patch-repair endonuclease